jgi:hypothetical protein
VGAGVAYAYFTSTGSGTGSAKVGTAANLTITQVGAGYDSLISSSSADPYLQDQCFNCSGPSELGNDITLANPGQQQLVSVVVAMRNWGAAVSDLPITLDIYSPSVSPEVLGNLIASDTTQTFSFAADNADGSPSLTNITFDFPLGTYVPQEFVYGISYGSGGPSLNVALSSSANDLTVGTDTTPGTIWLNDTNGNNNDFPSCTSGLPTAGFAQISTSCGPQSAANPGAYGTSAEVAAGNGDIPAVDFNVIGGVVPSLYPGGPSQPVDFAVTNPGPSSVYVTTVSASVNGLTVLSDVQNGSNEACTESMYLIAGSPDGVDTSVPAGSTVIESPSGMTISMTNDGNNQDNCEGATVGIGFTSP